MRVRLVMVTGLQNHSPYVTCGIAACSANTTCIPVVRPREVRVKWVDGMVTGSQSQSNCES